MPSYDKETEQFDAELMASTDDAYLFDIDGTEVWCPKCYAGGAPLAQWTPKTKDGVVGTVELPGWFVREEKLG